MPEQKEVCGITIRSDFPDRVNSPDPEKVIRKLVEHGTWRDVANEVDIGESTLWMWSDKYPEIEEAYMKGSKKLAGDAEQTMACIMRGTLPESAHEDVEVPSPSEMLRAARKILAVNHQIKDYSQSQTIVRKEPGQESEQAAREELKEMDNDDLLDLYNEVSDE